MVEYPYVGMLVTMIADDSCCGAIAKDGVIIKIVNNIFLKTIVVKELYSQNTWWCCPHCVKECNKKQ